MSRLNCDIVRDLTPSYLERICSESSREAVEEHLAECEKCKNYIQMMRQTELVSKEAEQGQLDYMKKVKHHFNQKNRKVVFCCGWIICFLLTLWMMLSVMPSPFSGMSFLVERASYVLYPVFAVVLWLTLAKYHCKIQKKGRRIAVGILGVAGLLYSVGVMDYCIWCAMNDVTFFGVPTNRMGPVVAVQLIVIAIVEFALTVMLAAQAIHEESHFGLLHVITLLGAFVSMRLYDLMGNMEVFEAYLWRKNTMLLVFVAEGIIVTVILMLMQRYWSKRTEK